MSEVVLFVPGFFGFGSFGHPDRPLVEYFAHVEDALLRAHLRPLRFAIHQPPPAGSLLERARSLQHRILELVARDATKLHLVGHSSGGVDARLVCNAKYTALPQRPELEDKIASVTTLSAPLHGTPLARRLDRGLWLAAPAVWFGSILASRGRLRLAGQLGNLWSLAKRVTLQTPTPTEETIAQLADVDPETAVQIRHFLADVARDHGLVDDLKPEAMAKLNQELAGGDRLPLRSFVSVAPRAGFAPLTFATAPLQRILFDVVSRLTAAPPLDGERTPAGRWIDAHHIELGETSNDGVVPAWSQTMEGRAEGIVLGDHLDVIGHFESANATFLRSGSKFDEPRFRALWAAIAKTLD
jgi:hypothetical protein